jgi:transposase
MAFDICQDIKNPARGKGRPRNDLSEAAFSMLYKVYSTLSGRRFMPQLHEAHDSGYIEKVLHYNRLSECLANEDVTDILKSLIVKTSRPLAAVESVFAMDSTGFAGKKIVNWQDSKYRGKKEHNWTKVHIMTGVNTQIVTDAVILGPNADDHKQLPDLLYNTAKYFHIREVLGDKGYSKVECHEEITDYHADPYIPFKIDATGGSASKEDVWERAYHYYMLNRAEFLLHYHQRSNVETAIMRIKKKFGNYVRSRGPTAMKNEVLAKIICHNICTLIRSMYELKIAAEFLADKLKEPV